MGKYPQNKTRSQSIDALPDFAAPTQPQDRSLLFLRRSEVQILQSYRALYGLGGAIGMAQVRQHAELESPLTDRLLASTPSERAQVFREAYSALYSELPWLTGTGTHHGAEDWVALMRPATKVYEIGSGSGYLIRHLAAAGYQCIGTDLSDERGANVSMDDRLEWRRSDGVCLIAFESPATYDYVVSDQVVEHLHPHDIIEHFKQAWALLKPGGSYLCRTPHRHFGPSDLSRVFGLDAAVFMHLHEFTWTEMAQIAAHCGYKPPKAIFRLPRIARSIRPPRASRLYFRYLRRLETLSQFFTASRVGRGIWRGASRYLLAPRGIWVALKK